MNKKCYFTLAVAALGWPLSIVAWATFAEYTAWNDLVAESLSPGGRVFATAGGLALGALGAILTISPVIAGMTLSEAKWGLKAYIKGTGVYAEEKISQQDVIDYMAARNEVDSRAADAAEEAAEEEEDEEAPNDNDPLMRMQDIMGQLRARPGSTVSVVSGPEGEAITFSDPEAGDEVIVRNPDESVPRLGTPHEEADTRIESVDEHIVRGLGVRTGRLSGAASRRMDLARSARAGGSMFEGESQFEVPAIDSAVDAIQLQIAIDALVNKMQRDYPDFEPSDPCVTDADRRESGYRGTHTGEIVRLRLAGELAAWIAAQPGTPTSDDPEERSLDL